MEKIALFLVGMLTGATLLLAMKGHDLDQLYLQMGRLRAENNQLQEEIDSLKKDLLDRQRQSIRRVKKIEVEVTAPDEFTKLVIAKRVKDQARPLLDKEVSYLEKDPRLVAQLIDGRIVNHENQSYQLHVYWISIGETLHIWVEGIKQPISS